jgi:hypothetical protein
LAQSKTKLLPDGSLDDVLRVAKPVGLASSRLLRCVSPQVADIVAKVAEAPLWNSNLKQSNRGALTFESMLRIRARS